MSSKELGESTFLFKIGILFQIVLIKKKKAHPESYGKQVKQVVDFGACANRNVLNTLT